MPKSLNSSQLCVLCDKYHGSFYRVRKKCEELLLRLNQQAQLLGDDSAEAVAPTLSASSGGVGERGSSASASLPQENLCLHLLPPQETVHEYEWEEAEANH